MNYAKINVECTARHDPTSSKIDDLTGIWERILNRSSIGASDNFFDLGGNPSLAFQMFAEISRIFGRDLPPVTICYTPTIEALASLLAQPTPPPLPPTLLLKPGTYPPVFIAHGMSGSILEFSELVGRIRSSHAIYGLQAKSSCGAEPRFARVEDIAQSHLEAIQKLQPHGPYFLVGYSFGGLVTLEIARHLSDRGERIALLAMVDTYPHIRYLSIRQRVPIVARLAKLRASAVMRLPIRERVSYFSRAVFYLASPSLSAKDPSQNSKRGALSEASKGASFLSARQRASYSDYMAWMHYRPYPYSGDIKFVRAAVGTEFPLNPVAVWAKLARKFELETVPGDHKSMLVTHYERLASVLSRFFEDASRQ
ncbi:MAG: thioesterase domain-containing protein [Candidatus Acidiferrales bacterium]